MKLSWFNTSEAHNQYQAYIWYEQYDAMQDIKEREFRDSGSNANAEICFEIQATALRPRLHTEEFPLYIYTGLPTQGTSTEDLGNRN